MTRRLKALVGIAVGAMLMSTPVDAKPSKQNGLHAAKVHQAMKFAKVRKIKRPKIYQHRRQDVMPVIVDRFGPDGPSYSVPMGATFGAVRHARRDIATHSVGSQVVGSRPAGCPRRYCGCALALRHYGRIVPALNVAENWKGLPRASAAPGMIAARRGHVFELRQHVAGNTWVVWDPNSGRGAIRIHARSIAGYTIHNPHGQLTAYNGQPGRGYRTRRVRLASR